MFNMLVAGLWPMVWKLGTTGALIAGLLFLYFATPAWLLPGLRRLLPWAAGVLAVSLVSYSVGVVDEHRRVVEQERIATERAHDSANEARKAAEKSVGGCRAPDGHIWPCDRLPNDGKSGHVKGQKR